MKGFSYIEMAFVLIQNLPFILRYVLRYVNNEINEKYIELEYEWNKKNLHFSIPLLNTGNYCIFDFCNI